MAPALALTAALGLIAHQAVAQAIQETAVYRERMALPARILLDVKPLFLSDIATPVTAGGSPTSVSITLRRFGAAQANRPLEATYWKAVELAGKPVPALAANREAHLLFQAGGRVSGSDGCNRITGGYELKGDSIRFGQMAGTQMACVDTAGLEQAFRAALKSASRLTIAGDRLELFDESGTRVAAFEGRAQASWQATTPPRLGTRGSWSGWPTAASTSTSPCRPSLSCRRGRAFPDKRNRCALVSALL